MSTVRALGAYRTPLVKGPNGRNLCRWCKVEVSSKRRTFCGKPECLHEWRLRSDPGYVRVCVRQRDHGICAECGTRADKWEADHIVPVVEGGGLCGLDGYRTLCIPCHKRVTAELRARLAARAATQDPTP